MATRVSVSPGFKTFYDDADPSHQYRVNETTAEKTISTDGGRTWTRDATQVGDTPGEFGNFIEHFSTSGGPEGFGIGQNGSDTIKTLLKNAPATIGGPALAGGFGDTGAFGFNSGETSLSDFLTKVAGGAAGSGDGAATSSSLSKLLIPGLMSIGGKIGESLLAPRPQHYSSFAGTENDPGKLLSEAGSRLRDVFSNIAPKLLAPPDLRDAYVRDLPAIHGDNLPISVDGHARWTDGRRPSSPVLDGMLKSIAPTDPTASQSGPTRVPAPGTAAPASASPNARTLGAVQMLLHLAQPSVAAGALA